LVIPAVASYQAELFPEFEGLRLAVFPGDVLDSTTMVKWISLLLGGVMLSIGRIKNFIRKMPSLEALAQLGWLSMVLALYWLVMRLVLQLSPLERIMNILLPMIIGGFVAVILFGGQRKGRNFFKGVGAGLSAILPTALDSISNFGNIISFIRLFAVGLAGAALAQSFNSMAPKGGVVALIAAAIILLLGHTLNLVLNALSVLVHGVRLNVLEFSGQLDIEWAGFNYDPFRLRVPEEESPATEKE
jgi:V/A-type H+-transporting ATPase subunit I